MRNNEDHFKIMRKIVNKPEASQRQLAEELDFSLGKLNYCIKSLNEKTARERQELITNLPNFESDYELMHKKF